MQREAGGRGCERPPPTRWSRSDISGVSRRLIRSDVAVGSHPTTRLDRTDAPSATSIAGWIWPCILCSRGGGRAGRRYLPGPGVSVGAARCRVESAVGRSLRPRWLAPSTGCAPHKPCHVSGTNERVEVACAVEFAYALSLSSLSWDWRPGGSTSWLPNPPHSVETSPRGLRRLQRNSTHGLSPG